MKTILLATSLTLGLVALAACQSSDGGLVDADMSASAEETVALAKAMPSLDDLESALGLSADQKAGLSTAMESFHEAMVARHAQLQAGEETESTFPRLDFLEEAYGILERDQFSSFMQIMNEKHEAVRREHHQKLRDGQGPHGPRHGHGRRGGGDAETHQARAELHHARMMDFFDTVLDLSDEQRTSLEELFASQRAFREEAHADGQRPTREQMQEHHQAMYGGIQEILNDEQMELLETLHVPGRGRRHRGG